MKYQNEVSKIEAELDRALGHLPKDLDEGVVILTLLYYAMDKLKNYMEGRR